jgi:hypothetical protein
MESGANIALDRLEEVAQSLVGTNRQAAAPAASAPAAT